MVRWLVAIVVALLLAAAPLLGAAARRTWRRALLATALRAAALALVLALLLDAPAGRARAPRPFAAIDVSLSATRGRDATGRPPVRPVAGADDADSLFAFGDSLRPFADGAPSADTRSSVRPAVERALAAGRALIVSTDGELDDPDALRLLPAGSAVRVDAAPARADAALAALDAPRAVVAGDTVELQATVVAGAGGVAAADVEFTLDGRTVGRVATGTLGAWATRDAAVRIAMPAGARAAIARAVLRAPGDAEPRNDTLAAAIEVAEGASAVFVSTQPDQDARWVVALLRGALALPTRGYYRVAPGEWRREGDLSRATEAEVRAALRAAPLAVLHGDTAALGAPRALGRGSLALVAPPPAVAGEAPGADEFFATGAPSSPLAPALAGLPWDSLPPLEVAARMPAGEWEALETRRARRGERRVAIVGSATPRRVVVVGAGGFWRWRFRGGAPADAFAALWGGVFDWLAEERLDARVAVPAAASVRAGEPVRWRRGSTAAADTTAVQLTRRSADTARATTVTLRFAPGASVAETAPLAPGIYDAVARGGRALLVVNPSRELVPRPPTVRAGRVGGAPPPGTAPPLRGLGGAYVAAALLLCGEWVLRRRMGMR